MFGKNMMYAFVIHWINQFWFRFCVVQSRFVSSVLVWFLTFFLQPILKKTAPLFDLSLFLPFHFYLLAIPFIPFQPNLSWSVILLFSFSVDNKFCLPCLNKSQSGERPTPKQFDKFLPLFLKDIPEIKCAKGGHAAYGRALQLNNLSYPGIRYLVNCKCHRCNLSSKWIFLPFLPYCLHSKAFFIVFSPLHFTPFLSFSLFFMMLCFLLFAFLFFSFLLSSFLFLLFFFIHLFILLFFHIFSPLLFDFYLHFQDNWSIYFHMFSSIASYFMSYHTILKTSDDFVSALKSAYEIADKITKAINDPDIKVFPYR